MKPLKEVMFLSPAYIPGCSVPMTTVVPMEMRLAGGQAFTCPQPFLDEETREIVIGDRRYPPSRVHYYVMAVAAKSKPQEVDLDRYTIGKRAPKRFKIAVDDVTDLDEGRGPRPSPKSGSGLKD